MMRRFSLTLVVVALLPVPAEATGTHPSDPISLSIEGPTQFVNLTPSQPEAWLEVSGNPSGISHLNLETLGNHDTRLFLYRNLDDALADEYVADDDDSGANLNARIIRFLGYPLPWLLKVTLYDPTSSGTPEVQCTSSLNPPGTCPTSGPCTFVLATRGKPGARDLLAIMRGIRNFLLSSSPRGPELIDLYYRISWELLFDVVMDSSLRDRFFEIGSAVLPQLRAALKVGFGDPSGAVVSEEALFYAKELTNLLSTYLTPNLRKELFAWTRQLEAQAGKPFKEAMENLQLLPKQVTEFTLGDEDVFPTKRGELITKLHRQPPASPRVIAGQLLTGLPQLDSILGAFYVDEVTPFFQRRPAAEPGGLDRILRLRMAADQARELKRALRSSPDVAYAESISVFYLTSDDLYYGYQYALEAIDAPAAWETSAVSTPLVGIIDTGIDWRQADLINRTRTDLGWNFVDDTIDTMDDHGHGTHVAGTVASEVDNLYSVAGVCPDAQVVPYKVCNADGNCTEDDLAEAIVAAADAGVGIVNMSLGGPFSQVVQDAMAYAFERNVLMIAAAGNDGQEGSSFPASSSYTLSVGATDEQDQLAGFSNWGDLDLTAPGVDIVNLALEGESCNNSGTSMAAPHAAGVAALVASRKSDVSPTEVIDRLLLGGQDLGDPGYDPYYGHGLVNALNSLTRVPAVHWPLAGTPAERGVNLPFGDNWTESCSGLIKRHAGVDLQATAGEDVYAAHGGTVAAVPDGGTVWAHAVTVEDSWGFTTVYWHIDPFVVAGDSVTLGERIGTVANLGGNTHLHLGFRKAPYANFANRGALPQQACEGDPPFPEFFEDPQSLTFGHLFIRGRTIAASQVMEACNTLAVGQNFRVETPAHLTLRAGRAVALRDGFAVANGASLTVEIAPPILCR